MVEPPDKGRDLAVAIREFDLVRYCQDHAGDQVSTHDWILDCPECGKRKLTVAVQKQGWHCWVCEAYSGGKSGRGGLVSLICLLDGCTPKEAVNRILLGGRFSSIPIDRLPDDFVVEVFDNAGPSPTIPGPEFYRPILVDGILPYMVKRGITLEDAVAFGLGWCWEGRYRGRLVFPVFEDRRLVYYQARAMWEETDQPKGTRYLKALNPPKEVGSISSNVLMNLDVARQYPRVAVVEGPIDCVKTGPSAVATFGKRIYPRQIGKLIRAGVRAIDLMWDGPGPKEPQGALPEMMAAAPLLAAFFDVQIVLLDQGDPGQRSRAELDWYRKHRSQPANRLSRLAVL
jgi:hypothetical protein